MKTLQVRNVPDHLHRQLKARAAMEGRTLSDLVLEELAKLVERPTLAELVERVRTHEQITEGESGAEAVHAERVGR